MSERAYEPKPKQISGFSLYGERLADGTVVLGAGDDKTYLPDFPSTVLLLGAVYTLESVHDSTHAAQCWGDYA